MQTRNQNNIFNNTLKELEFSLDEALTPEIVFLSKENLDLHPKHYIALEFAEIFNADAVFFKYYNDNRYCVPQIYFYDNTINERTALEIAEIHKRVYSSCQVPMICVIDKTNITLFDCRKPITEKNNIITNENCIFYNDTLNNITALKTYFSAKQLNYGLFWETEEASKSFLNNQSAYEKLISVLTEIRNDFIQNFVKHNISKEFADDLLFKCILIKYLEENGKENGKNYAFDFYKRNKLTNNSLNDILINGEIVNLLDALENHFNGGVFSIKEQERGLLHNIELTTLAEHLEGKLGKNKQIELWNIYSFKDIPIELISNFYEEFIPKTEENSGTVYTPSFLVNLLIDECLPLSNKKEDKEYNIKLIDVSCGSGIFITSAFKRLVQRWRIAKGENGRPLCKDDISLNSVKQILSQNIYGVDINATASKLTNFSLHLALCQIVPNNQLWNWANGRIFSNLNNNIFTNNYFDFLVSNQALLRSFDLIIGNPPFKKLKENELKEIENKLINNNIELSKNTNSKKQLALTFLESMMFLVKENTGKICQIVPSGEILYFYDSCNFRNVFFEKYNVNQIIDFTLLRRNLFVSKNNDTTVPVVAIFAENKKPTDEPIIHIAIRRTNKNKEKIYFEIDYYDFYEVDKTTVLKNKFIWKSNLYGGSRVLELINKLYKTNYVKLNSYLKEIGITLTKHSLSDNSLIRIRKSITNGNFPIIQTRKGEAIELYSNERDILNDFYNSYLLNDSIKKINNFCIAVTSGRQGLRGAYTIIDSDFFNLPYIINNIEVFSAQQQIIINDIIDYKITEFGMGENAQINAQINNRQFLIDFSDTFCREINTIYNQKGKQLRLRSIIEGSGFFACEFYYGTDQIEPEYIEHGDREIDSLLKQQVGNNLMYNKIMRIYADKNTITLIKPKNLRYWLKSIALRDADDTFDDILQSGF